MTKTELKQAMQARGSHFFDRDTMRFFKSKLISVYTGPHGTFFVTYERGPHGPGGYSVRKLTPTGSATIGEFMGRSRENAMAEARALAGRRVTTEHRRKRS